MSQYKEIVSTWSEDVSDEFKKGIQGIVRRLNNDKLIDYIIEVSETKYNNSKVSNSYIRKLKLELAKKELQQRLQSKE